MYARHDEHQVTMTKQGILIYNDNAANFHDWEFRASLGMFGARSTEERLRAVGNIVDGLRCDAFTVAQEVGTVNLAVLAGITILVVRMKEIVFPLTTAEAKELFKHCCKPTGLLVRQHGESMKQYTSSRRRCWDFVQLFNPDTFSERYRADMLLDLSGFDRGKRIMEQTWVSNARN